MKNAMFEALEMRALMSLVVDLRVAGGGDAKEVAVTHVGQQVQLEAWGVVTGVNDVTDEAMQSAMGSFLSSAGGAALGDLSVTRVAPFNYLGSQPGRVQDLDADGDLDIGGANTTNAGDYYNARAQFMQFTGEPLPDGQPGGQFKLADVTFTVTQLLSTTATTEVNFQPRPNSLPGFHAIWREDDTPKNPRTGTYAAGTPVLLTVTPATISGSVFIDENGNGIRQEDDKGAAGWLVFDDVDGDGVHDLNEASALTDADGIFSLDVVPGTHTIRIAQQAGYEPSKRLPTSYTFTVAALDEAGGAVFGQEPI